MDFSSHNAPSTGSERRGASGEKPSSTNSVLRTAMNVVQIAVDVLLAIALPLAVAFGVGMYQLSHPPKIVSTATPKQYGLAYHDVTLKTSDGISLAAWDVDSAVPSDTAILVLHGIGNDRGAILARTAFLAPRYRLLYIDFRSYGASGGSYSTLGVTEINDALAGIDYLRAQGVKRIGIYGFSMGGSVALRAAARSTDVRAVVTEEAYADVRAVVDQPYRYLGPLRTPLATMLVALADVALRTDALHDTPAAAAATLRIPVFVIHAQGDQEVPVAQAYLLKDSLRADPEAAFWFSEGASGDQDPAQFSSQVKNFFDRALSAAQ